MNTKSKSVNCFWSFLSLSESRFSQRILKAGIGLISLENQLIKPAKSLQWMHFRFHCMQKLGRFKQSGITNTVTKIIVTPSSIFSRYVTVTGRKLSPDCSPLLTQQTWVFSGQLVDVVEFVPVPDPVSEVTQFQNAQSSVRSAAPMRWPRRSDGQCCEVFLIHCTTWPATS